MRCFVAIKLPQEIRAEAVSIQNALRPLDLHAKWVEEKNLHLTLKFLGEVREADLERAKEIVASVSSFAKPFVLDLSDIGAFANLRNPRVVWLGVKPMANPVVIVEYLEGAFQQIGLPAERRTPHPHITLARIKSPKNVQKLEPEVRSIRVKELEWEVSGVSLFKSTLKPSGPVYEEVFEARFSP